MKSIQKIAFIFCLVSCSSTKQIDNNVVNDFFRQELKLDKYLSYSDSDIYILEDANPIYGLKVYEYAFYEKNKNLKNNTKVRNSYYNQTDWLLDSLKIEQLKVEYGNNENVKWNENEIKGFNYKIINKDSFLKMTNPQNYIDKIKDEKNKPKLIIQITKPIFIDSSKSLLYFKISSVNLYGISTTIERFAISMQKDNGKWIKNKYYYDGEY